MAKAKTKRQPKRFVVVRTYSAGVHCGFLVRYSGTEVVLTEARRIWRWRGANTLHELSLHGCDNEWSRISEPVESITLTQAIEIIDVPSADTRSNLMKSRWGK